MREHVKRLTECRIAAILAECEGILMHEGTGSAFRLRTIPAQRFGTTLRTEEPRNHLTRRCPTSVLTGRDHTDDGQALRDS